MSAYAVAHLHEVVMNDDIIQYLDGIDATLAPFEGRFIVHGAPPEVREGQWRGDLIIIEFPSLAKARAWYGSDAYRVILPLRTNNSRGAVILIDGVEAGHRAGDILR
ncbi:DUF1330 domain-containing protein [Caballeronia sp. LZ034LL]|uniref:DUF1330 domain-containing protein n=1 Tax=Caballeronia sp. LZ034LL TaxID=3038567 RepID=UPI0028612CA3|nr:DUF1330 domain-containing protein [Caballeronia sp. LZ034LL]MDR5837883.1 DUF1330 domain-containing protein [Caballeronia sp. LZ034LL]